MDSQDPNKKVTLSLAKLQTITLFSEVMIDLDLLKQ